MVNSLTDSTFPGKGYRLQSAILRRYGLVNFKKRFNGKTFGFQNTAKSKAKTERLELKVLNTEKNCANYTFYGKKSKNNQDVT